MRIYVCDTNVMLSDSKFYENSMFEDGKIYVTFPTISEIDNIKERSSDMELKWRARKASRELEKGIESGLIFLADTDDSSKDESFCTYDVMDDLILSTALSLTKSFEVVMVSKDLNMRLKSRGKGLEVMDYIVESDDDGGINYSGYLEITTTQEKVDTFYREGFLAWGDLVEKKPYPNQFIIAESEYNPKSKIVGRYIHNSERFERLKYENKDFYGFRPKDIYQRFALELLLDPDVKVVTLTSPPGCGKSFMALGAMLELVVNENTYDKLLIGKNTSPLDRNSYQGYTSGTTTEKLLTHFNNYMTTLENLHENRDRSVKSGMKLYEALNAQEMLDVLDISSILGSSFNHKAIIVDEFESFDVNASRSILTRISDTCKLVILGDINQQTITKLRGEDNGLYCAVEWLKDLDGIGHMSFSKSYRGTIVEQISSTFDGKLFK